MFRKAAVTSAWLLFFLRASALMLAVFLSPVDDVITHILLALMYDVSVVQLRSNILLS